MSYQEKPADNSTDVYFGIEWNESSSGATFSITPKIYRWDRYSTNNSGGHWSEDLTEPSGSAGSWSGLSFGSGSGYRVIDSFAKRTYSKSHSTSTIHYHLYTDASFGTYNGSSFVTLGAQTWTFTMTIPAKSSYSVTYYNNGGGTAPSAQTKWYGEELALRGAITNRTGYVFKNWNTKSDGTGTAYAAGAKYTGNAALTLYAQWYAPYKVSFNANSGSGAPGNQTKVYNTTLKLSTTVPTRTGYTFKGWATTQARANAGTVDYSSGANYTTNASATLYAVWQINTWAVTYDGNGATGGSTSSQTKTYNQALTLRTNGFTRTNYNFVNWNTAANGSGTSYAAGASYTGNTALKLYAQWKVAHSNPTIQSITVKRCDADGTENVEGTRMHVVATWKVDNTTDGFTDTTGSTFKVTLDGTTDTVNLSGTSGTVDFVHSATAAIGSSYTVTSVLADSKGYSTTRTSALSVAYFTMHFKAGGTGVGIGKPSTEDDLLDIGMDVRAASGKAIIGPLTTSSSVSFDSANPKIEFQNANANQNGQLIFTDYDAIHTGATLAWITDQSQSWFHTQYVKATSNVDVDGTVVKRWPAMKYDTAPSATIYTQPTTTYDNAGNIVGHDEYAQTTAKSIQHNFAAVRQYNGSAWSWYQCSMVVSSAGAVTYSIHTPAAFRNAIGASSGTWPQSVGGTGRAQTTANRTYWCGRILYDNNTGTSGTVKLAETAANFAFMFIGIRSDSSQYTGLFVRSPNGKKVDLACVEAASNYNYIKTRLVTISGTSISGTTATHTGLSGSAAATSSANEVYITHVIGFS